MNKHFLRVSTTNNISIVIEIQSTKAFLDNLLVYSFWDEFIPDCELNLCDENATPIITIIESSRKYIDESLKIIYANKNTYTQVIVYIDAQLEPLRQLQHLYTIHGSCIRSASSSTFALIGAVSGLGKTTLAADSVEYGFRWIFDEKFIVDNENKLRGGVSRALNDEKTKKAQGNKSPQGIESVSLHINAVIIPIVTSEDSCTVHALSLDRRVWQLYDETTRDIRLINGRLDGYEQPLQSKDSLYISQLRKKDTDRMALGLPIYYMRGSSSAILERLSSLI